MKMLFKKMDVSAHTVAWIALALAIISCVTTAMIIVSLPDLIEKRIDETVRVSKIRLAELDAANRFVALRADFEKNKSVDRLVVGVSRVEGALIGLYTSSKSETLGNRLKDIEYAFDVFDSAAGTKDVVAVLRELDAIIALLRDDANQ